MPEDDGMEKKEKGFVSNVFPWVAVVFALAALYVLSFGPVYKFVGPGRSLGSHTVQNFYAPVLWICDRSGSADQFMGWYLGTVWGIR